jgi:predicted AlkP superfamily pyrophosphatase or phosphodiesterase
MRNAARNLPSNSQARAHSPRLAVLAMLAVAAAAVTGAVGGGRVAGATGAATSSDWRGGAPAKRNVTLLVSIDAFRWDYVDRPAAARIRGVGTRGVRVERLVPSFPSKTYPNHYTLVTGLFPEHHGIIANVMLDSTLGRFATGNDPAVRDGRWFGGEPIWVTAVKHGLRAYGYQWPGDEAEIAGYRPTWYAPFDGKLSRANVVRQVLTWLALPPDSVPDFMTAYFSDVDVASHAVGPDGARTDTAIAAVDSAVGALVDGIARLGMTDRVNLVIVSDHGMAAATPERTIYLDDYVSLDSLEVVDWSPVATIQPKPGREGYVYEHLHGAHPHLAVYRKADVPARLHFSANPRITALVGIADEGWSISTRARGPERSRGVHGYDNLLPSMGGVLVAEGPGLRRATRVPPLGNVHVYSLLAALLGVPPAPTDGSPDSVRALLRTN